MKVGRTSASAFTVTFESTEELDEEYKRNLKAGGLRLETAERPANFTALTLTLRLKGGGEAAVRASVVGVLPGALALAVEGNAQEILAALKTVPVSEGPADAPEKDQNVWDKLRSLSHLEKVMLAAKAERPERAILVQDNDPQVLYQLLKNPRIGAEEVARIAKSPFLSYQVAELILKTPQWGASLDVKLGLIHNNKTPTAMALRILPTLPTSEVSRISRGSATSQALKQAALKILQGS